VTERAGSPSDSWSPLLSRISRASGHELRNALNALVVNLEVVRGRTSGSDAAYFVNQSVEQSEESVRVAEACIALLDLVTRAIGPDGALRRDSESGETLAFDVSEEDALRAERLLKPLADRGALSVGRRGSTVILSIR
jgi:hypothetical protein